MKRLILLGALGALFGCRTTQESQTEQIALIYSNSEASKADALAAGDEVFVYASVDGAGTYFMERSTWTVASDGHTLTPPQSVFYPDAKQAAVFWAYFGAQRVSDDQSTAAALKQADLCWAAASSTPSTTPVPLTFRHVFARLAVTCSQPTAKITILNAFSGGTLDVRSGSFANGTKSDVSTAGNELIVPAQTLNRLLITSNGIDYVFDGSIALEAGKTTTANLTLNTSAKTASLSGSSVAAWTASAQSGALEPSGVSNALTLHWPNYVPQGAAPDKVVFTIQGTDYTVSSGVAYANQTFTVPFASAALRYPYTVSKITFYRGSAQALPSCTQLLGTTIYKSGTQTLGIKDQANVVKIGNLWWATGNLVSDGPNACKIGAPSDYGLYFAYASLVGWSGGANGDGTGQGSPAMALKVQPTGYTGTTGYPGGYLASSSPGTGYYYPATDNAATGIGDPCRFYLGSPWISPTSAQLRSVRALGASGWTTYLGAKGAWLGPTPHTPTNALFSPAVGVRYGASMSYVGTVTYIRLPSYDDQNSGPGVYHFNSAAANVWSDTYVQSYTYGIPARCVRPI